MGVMVKPEWFSSAQMQALNPALVMILIPFNHLVLYPALRHLSVDVTRMRGWIRYHVLGFPVDRGRLPSSSRSMAAKLSLLRNP
jgi:hypothetical protein